MPIKECQLINVNYFFLPSNSVIKMLLDTMAPADRMSLTSSINFYLIPRGVFCNHYLVSVVCFKHVVQAIVVFCK